MFVINIGKQIEDYHKLNSDKNNLEKTKGFLEIQLGKMNVYEEMFKDRQEENKKRIEDMAKFFIEACEIGKTYKPSNQLLSEMSDISESLWKEQKRNEIFSKFLMGELTKRYRLAKKKDKREFWQKAINFSQDFELMS
jgi:hypothetical protein